MAIGTTDTCIDTGKKALAWSEQKHQGLAGSVG